MTTVNEHVASLLENDDDSLHFQRKVDALDSGVHGVYAGDTLMRVHFNSLIFSTRKAKGWLTRHELDPFSFVNALHEPVRVGSDNVSFQLVSSPFEVDKVKQQSFRKEVVKVGRYVKDADGLEFEVTPQLLEHWATTFSRMQKNGVKIPIPLTHDESGNPENNRGWVTDLFVDQDALVMSCVLFGEDAAELAAKSDVSLFAPPNFTDGKGEKYEWPVMHIAMVTDPVIPGLGDFVPIAIAASHRKGKEMNWKEIQESMGIKGDMTDKTAPALVMSRMKGIKEESAAAISEIVTLKETVTAAKKGSTQKDVDPTLLKLSADNRSMKIQGLVAKGRITPDIAKQMSTAFIGADNAALKLELSREPSGATFDHVVDLFAGNDPVQLQEVTREQSLKLSSNMDEGDSDMLLKDAEKRAALAKAS